MNVLEMDACAIGKKLVELRGEKKQGDVAKSIGVSVSALSMYECGERIPRDNIKLRIAAYYGKTIQSIFYE